MALCYRNARRMLSSAKIEAERRSGITARSTLTCGEKPDACISEDDLLFSPRVDARNQKQIALRRQPECAAREGREWFSLYFRRLGRPDLSRPALQLAAGLQRSLRRKRRLTLGLADHRLQGHMGVERRGCAQLRRSDRNCRFFHKGQSRVAETMRAFRTLLGGSDMLAYLAMMGPRLIGPAASFQSRYQNGNRPSFPQLDASGMSTRDIRYGYANRSFRNS